MGPGFELGTLAKSIAEVARRLLGDRGGGEKVERGLKRAVCTMLQEIGVTRPPRPRNRRCTAVLATRVGPR